MASRTSGPGVFGTFGAMLTAQVVGAVLGLLFWIVVARFVDAEQVGIAAAAIAAQTVLGLVGTMGLQTLMMAELPHLEAARRRTMVHAALLASLLAGAAVGLVVVGGHDVLGTTLRRAVEVPGGAVVFVLGAGAASAAHVVDGAAVGVERNAVQVWRNFIASSLRFPLAAALVAVGHRDAVDLQVVWVLPLLLSIVIARLRLQLEPLGDAESPLRGRGGYYARRSLAHHWLTLAISAGSQLVPVLAGLLLMPRDNAAFAIAWMLASFVFLPPFLLATALFAHGASVGIGELRRSMQSTLPAALALSGLLCLGAWVLGKPVLLLFGGDYPDASWLLLSLLVPGGLWMVFKDHLVALWRAQERHVFATVLASLSVVVEMTGATVGGLGWGATGLCAGWLLGCAVSALAALPLLRSAFRGLEWVPPTRVVAELVASVRGGDRA